jgi:DNA polymerase-1
VGAVPKLMLVDGNSLTYRAFFALPTDMATASGQVTNAVFGFTSMLINLLRDHKPDHVAVAFDRPEPTFRHEAVDTYKANRSAAPDILRQQMGLVREVLTALAMPVIELPGYEADDIIATLATRARDEGIETIVVTGDRDSYQLVEDPWIKVLYNRRGVSDYALYDEAGIEEKTGVPPSLYVPYAALRGDTSDNLPGIAGVGEKTAAKLINTYGGIEGIFEHLDDQTPKLRASLADPEVQARVRSNEQVMRLVRDAPVDLEPADLAMGTPDAAEVKRLFDFLEFRTLLDRLYEALASLGTVAEPVAGSQAQVLEAEVRTVDAAGAVEALTSLAAGTTPLAVAAGEHGAGEGLALVADAATADVVWIPGDVVADLEVILSLQSLTTAGGRPIAAHDAKATMVELSRRFGVDVHTLALDTAIAAYLLDPADTRYDLREVLARYADAELPTGAGVGEGQLDFDGDTVDPGIEAARRALAVDRLVAPVLAALDAQQLRALNDDIEVPLVRVLAKMEIVGVGVDVRELTAIRDHLRSECERLRALVIEDAGFEFNVNSTKQLGEILFEQLGLPPQKKTKTGYSTDATSLEKLRGAHPIIEHLLDYREVEKLRSTYGEGLLASVAPDGRIHATFNQTVARTGRLSSDAPNLHNIPVRSETGRTFRKAFVPAPGYELLVADYNQIELRCIAHLAEDPGLIAAFTAGQDIHNATAARVFHVAPDEVKPDQRAKAKMVSYGLAYGMEAYGLGQRLGIPTEEAAVILDAYFEAFPAVKNYMETTVEQARQRGYTETLFGRRRQIPELSSSNFRIRQAGERQAMNAGIQGLAADIFKVALVRLDQALEKEGRRTRIVLQVHDEIVLEVPTDERDAAIELTVVTMTSAFALNVPLEVNVAIGPNWADAKL